MELLILGKENCSACDMTKTVLANKGIEFAYQLLNDLEPEIKKDYMKLAREQGKLSMPLIIKDKKILTLQEAIICI